MPSRTDTIRLLLERWHDLLEPSQAGKGGEPGLSLMPHDAGCGLFTTTPPRCNCYRASVHELERLFAELREREDLLPLRWQLLARYVRCQVVIRPVPVKSKRKRGTVVELVRQPVTVYDERVEARADGTPVPDSRLAAGLDWLAANWRGAEPVLPDDWQRLH